MNRVEVLERIAPLADAKVRTIEHTPRTRVVVTPDMVILRPGSGARTLEMGPEGVKSMAQYAGFSTELAKRLSPDTFGRVASELLDRKQRYNITLNEGRIIEFANPGRVMPIKPERLLSLIEARVGHAEYQRVMIHDHSVAIEVAGEREHAVVPGDIVRAGAMVSFSPIGTVTPEVRSYVLRLVCTNGATTNDIVREFQYGGEGDDLWQWFRESIKQAHNSAGRIVAHWRSMRNERITPGDRALVLEGMLRRARITGDMADAVRAQALAQPPENSYQMMNLITWASTHLLTEPREIRQAQQAAATFADETTHQRVCPVCHSSR